MTRANLNFIGQNPGELPRVLFHYHNGDQYPEGLLQYFGIEAFLTIDRLWTPDDFCTWIRGNYREACRKITTLPNGLTISAHAESDKPTEPEDLGEGGQPKIFYTGCFVTDFSYVFTHGLKLGRKRKDGSRRHEELNWVKAWDWDELIFDGPASKFRTFCQKRVKQEIIPGDVAAKAAVLESLIAVNS
ncbi:hypothetical protein BH10PLA2_BH10PLA2_25030 [soil metagenome]